MDDNFLNSRTLDELKEKIKNYYYLPPIDDDNPKYGEEWQHFPEVKGYDAFFDYYHNSTGFRDTEIETDVDVCYYGCSMTYGVGVPLEARWTNIVDNHFKFKSNNFGILGVGIPEITNLFLATNKFIKMKMAVFLLPDIHRFTLPIARTDFKNKILNTKFHPNYNKIYNCSNVSSIGKRVYGLPDIYFQLEFRRSLEIILEIARLSNIKVCVSSWAIDSEDIRKLINNSEHTVCVEGIIQDRRARDCLFRKGGEHPGIIPHKQFSNRVIDAIHWTK